MRKKFFTTRPTVACHLMNKGYTGKMVKNPYDEHRPAWEFPIQEGLLKEAEDFKRKLAEQGNDTKENETRVTR